MFLALTADTRFWESESPELFLGKWCWKTPEEHRRFAGKELPYHWDDRSRLYRDAHSLVVLYEDLLVSLGETLNHIHGVSFSSRYWRVLIGHWLYTFSAVVYDRSLSLDAAIAGNATHTYVTPDEPARFLLQNQEEFLPALNEDLYNHHLYSEILRWSGALKLEERAVEARTLRDLHWKDHLKDLLAGTANLFPAPVRFVYSYLPKAELLKLQWKLGQVPHFDFTPQIRAHYEYSRGLREELREHLTLKSLFPDERFQKLLLWLIPRFLPAWYLEGFADLRKRTRRQFGKQPKLVFTANSHIANDAFKLWVAEQMESGTRLIVGQHGGNYGTSKWCFQEEHEQLICDHYISWGWKHPSTPKVVPLPANKLIGRRLESRSDGMLYLVTNTFGRFFYRMFSVPVGPQVYRFLDQQMEFARKLSPEAKKLLVVRLYPRDLGLGDKSWWREKASEITLDEGQVPMLERLEQSRLFIGSHNTTTFLETMSANFPSVVFWDPQLWELRPEVEEDFAALRRVRILHESPEEAAHFVDEIFRNPTVWWKDTAVQKVRREYCDKYAATATGLDSWSRRFQGFLREEGTDCR